MSDDTKHRVNAPVPPAPDVDTVARGGGAPITDDSDLQREEVSPEGGLTVHHTKAARAAEQGLSPYGGLDPQRPNRSTLDNSPDNVSDEAGPVDNRY